MTSLFRRQSRQPNAVLIADDSGLRSEGAMPWRANWASVRRVSAYKVDLFIVDEIRVEFLMHDGAVRVVTEEDAGFETLMDQLVRRFPSTSGWQSKVLQPPFASQRTVLYSSEG